jgi:hypothetical protein
VIHDDGVWPDAPSFSTTPAAPAPR